MADVELAELDVVEDVVRLVVGLELDVLVVDVLVLDALVVDVLVLDVLVPLVDQSSSSSSS